MDDRYIVHIRPREADDAPEPRAGAVRIDQTRSLLLVYDPEFDELASFLL